MSTDFKIVIVGSGPAGLSAAAHAASKGVPHVLLERTDHINDTIFKYQKRKLVMATPVELPAQDGIELQFKEESREEVISSWTKTAAEVGGKGVNIRFNAEVTGVQGVKGDFRVKLAGGETITTEFVVLAVGAGNARQVAIPGANARAVGGDRPMVQYLLADPDEYQGERIAVIGVGDAGLENALGLAINNQIYLINTGDEFPRAKDANKAKVRAAFKIAEEDGPETSGSIVHMTKVEPQEVQPGLLVLHGADGTTGQIECDRVIARIGNEPATKFLASCNIQTKDVAPVSDTYESLQIDGLYIIGALGGYPLIKNCLNQGFEVVEYILGNPIPPADEPLLQKKLTPGIIRLLNSGETSIAAGEALAADKTKMTGAELIEHIRARAPMFSELKPVHIREFLIHAELHYLKQDAVVFERGESTDSLYTVLDGEVGIQIDPKRPGEMVRLGPGQFFGEMGLISGRKRTATVVATKPVLLFEVERNTILKLERTHPEVKKAIEDAAVIRQIKMFLAPHIDDDLLDEVVATSTVVTKKRGEVLIEEDDETDTAVYVIRKGSVTVSKKVADKNVVLNYVAAGNYVGEMALLMHQPRAATITAASTTEAIRVDSAVFRKLLDRDPQLQRRVQEEIKKRLKDREIMRRNAEAGDLISFLVRAGAGDATDILLIDESLCVRCDNCEKACAETHHGISRLDREAGPTFAMMTGASRAMVHVPTSCRHCEDPLCMTECPPDAIHRAANGEVYIESTCIGCGNCKNYCPYGVIQMAAPAPEKPPLSLLNWMLFGAGSGPGEDKSEAGMKARIGSPHAVKCDMCRGLAGPACVRACPTGAAIRVNPAEFIEVMRTGR